MALYIKNSTDGSLQHHPMVYKNEKLAVTKFFRDANGILYIGTNVSVFRLNKQNFTVEPLAEYRKGYCDETDHRIKGGFNGNGYD